jgi:hypothetical protein
MARWQVLLALVWPVAASAQDDAMEVQRCVWRCLADSPGAESAQYNQCVAAKCSESAAAPPVRSERAGSDLGGTPWSYGPTQDGQGFFAGQYAPDTGNILYYTCDRSGAQNLLLAGEIEGPAAVLNLEANGQVLGLWFVPTAGGFTSRLDPGSEVPELLASARRLALRNQAGWPLGAFGMLGAGTAINAARAACGL